MAEQVFDHRVVRGIVLHILKAYMHPEDPEAERDIEKALPLLMHADQPVREQAATVSRLWLGLKQRDPIRYRRLIFYRLRHLDMELERLNQMTRPKKKAQ